MARYDITVEVTYFYEVEADSDEEAEKQGWLYEDHTYNAEVQEIRIKELEDDDEDDIPDFGDATDAGIAGE